MTKKIMIVIVIGTLTVIGVFGNYWITTQPISISENNKTGRVVALNTPEKNLQIIKFLEDHGQELAPNYEEAVCTEFVIKVIDQFSNLTKDEKNAIRIITSKNLDSLVQAESSIIKGVQTALINGRKGVEVKKIEDVRPGDFFQFWNQFGIYESGHCGVVLEIKPNESITVYSSHPMTNGYGKQTFLWPDKIFFARLK